MIAPKIFNTQDLILQVTKSFDPEKLKLQNWDRFLDVLCSNRKYQKEAIKTALVYLASNRYKSIEDLVKENWNKNPNLAARYHSLIDYHNRLPLKNKLSATLDLATGTGKSFVIYGIAQIALGIGLVDRILVLCPSLTIKDELTRKFSEIASSSRVLEAFPDGIALKNPRIINSDQTIQAGDICVTNIHAVYANTSSSIFDSLSFGKGQSCLVLNDEVHHAYNRVDGRDKESQSLKKWSDFLTDERFNFRYILGFTGTAYHENEYFNNVIFRFSLREAIEKNYVKSVNYVHRDDSQNEYEKFQKIYQNHNSNKIKYPEVKPLTILITKDIKFAKQLHTRLVEFLFEKGEGTEEEIAKQKVLIITSDAEHQQNVLKLPKVDTDEHTEWIISVAMLTEGWDVKNVFQIVPMEEKAFNSKLLIAQVLGRGLRLPEKYPNAEVTVFNHDKWSGRIASLVNEILEIEQKIINSPLAKGERTKYHFKLHNINYDREEKTIASPEAKVFNYKDFIDLTSETFEDTTETMFVSIGGTETPVSYKIEKEKFRVGEIVDKIVRDFETRHWEGITLRLKEHEYTQNNLPPREEIEALIRRSMDRVGIEGDYLGKANRHAVWSTFNTLLRRSNVSISYARKANPIFEIDTKKRDHESISVLSLRQNATIYYTSEYEQEIVLEDTKTNMIAAFEDRTLPRGAFEQVDNIYNFKTPVDLVLVSHDPERKFVELLCKPDNASSIVSWIKSNNQKFYTVPYTVSTTIGRRTTHHSFNPDFFIKLNDDANEYIVVVEIKADDDDSAENKAKYRYAVSHFEELNRQLKESKINQEYVFHFLSPVDYSVFFQYLRAGKLQQHRFRSNLEKILLEENEL